MPALATFRAMPPAERRLFLEAAGALLLAFLAVALAPFRRIAASASRLPDRPPPPPAEQARQVRDVRRAVRICARRVPFRAKCFEQGLAALWMLRRRGIAATLHYGVATRPEGLAAHVWVRAGGADVIGCENAGDFAEVARFPGSA